MAVIYLLPPIPFLQAEFVIRMRHWDSASVIPIKKKRITRLKRHGRVDFAYQWCDG